MIIFLLYLKEINFTCMIILIGINLFAFKNVLNLQRINNLGYGLGLFILEPFFKLFSFQDNHPSDLIIIKKLFDSPNDNFGVNIRWLNHFPKREKALSKVNFLYAHPFLSKIYINNRHSFLMSNYFYFSLFYSIIHMK